MSVFLRGMQPKNGFTAMTIRFVDHFRELDIGWTHNKLISQGVEQFVDEFLPHIRFILSMFSTKIGPLSVAQNFFAHPTFPSLAFFAFLFLLLKCCTCFSAHCS
ncbi:unnamed protein product [Gongylonema pulchrum]|uniref:Uncharacterized protein n=1 Tax=Gongylonema pulchrum TaxID=637853 RepID=A0A183F055_9BILA|nr:unnamed protein product [Gongylonema pulchrum]